MAFDGPALEFTLTGDDKLDRAFQALPRIVQKKVLREGLRPAAKLVKAAAVAKAPKRTGALAGAIKVRAGKRSRKYPNSVRVQVAVGKEWFKGDEFYGAFEEFGWKSGRRVKKGRADHRKQIPGRHFIQGAYQDQGEAAKQVAQSKIVEGIEREAAALNG
jgi:HK97 gp10 family phage protein